MVALIVSRVPTLPTALMSAIGRS